MNFQISKGLQEYCEQFNTSLNTYSITHGRLSNTVTDFSCKDPIDEAKWAAMSNEAYSNNESSLNQVELQIHFYENKSGLPSHCSELYGCQMKVG